MTDEAPIKRPNARECFKTNGICIPTGYACEGRFDCRTCNVPVAMGQIQIVNAIRSLKEVPNDGKGTETTD